MGILLGILTALTWGGSDFLARFATHRMGTLRAMLYMQLIGFLLLTFFLPCFGGWGHLADGSGWQPWAWGCLAGCVNAISTLSLYRAFEIGKMAVVAPLSASYPVLSVSLSLLSGERLSAPRAVGIACTMVGVLLVAGGEKAPDANDEEAVRRSGKGISWALSSAVGFGVLFWLLGLRVIPRVGAPQTVWMIRLTCTAIAAAVILLARQPIGLPRNVRWISSAWVPAIPPRSCSAIAPCKLSKSRSSASSVLSMARSPSAWPRSSCANTSPAGNGPASPPFLPASSS